MAGAPPDPIAARCSESVITHDPRSPHHANSRGTRFGGRALELLDSHAAIACHRYARRPTAVPQLGCVGQEAARLHPLGAPVHEQIVRRRAQQRGDRSPLEDA
jgi:hypothetical protein